MLTFDVKRKINTLRDILVGKVPDPKAQVEQITIALIYKFMDDIDIEGLEFGGTRQFFTDEYEKYAWTEIMKPENSGQQRALLYAEGIEEMTTNPNLPQLFRDIFRGAYIPYRDPDTLNMFLKEVSDFFYDNSEDLGNAFEYLLSIMGSQGDAGQFRTPRHIIDMMVEIVDPKKHETILDPACGTAGFLISAYRHILAQNKDEDGKSMLTADDRKRLTENFAGYDISPDMVRLSRVNMYLHNFTKPKISEYDTLTNEEKWYDNYDVILANPPFMTPKGGIVPHSRYRVKAKRSEVLFVDYIAEHLNPKGRAAIIVPEGIVFQSANAYQGLRKYLVEDGLLYAVISLPAGVFNPYSGVKTSILLIDKALAKTKEQILFIKLNNDGFDLGAQRREVKGSDIPEIIRIVRKYHADLNPQTTDDEILHHPLVTIANKEQIAKQDYVLVLERYKSYKISNAAFPMVPLNSICQTASGGTPNSSTREYYENGTINWLKSGEVRQGLIYSVEQKITALGLKNSSAKIFPVDTVLVAMYGATAGQVGLLKVESTTNQAICGILPSDRIIPKFLFYLLKGKKDFLITLSTGGAQPNISQKIIRNLQIPLPPLPIQEDIIAELDSYQKIIEGARQVVENYKPLIPISSSWEVVPIKNLCENLDSKRIPITSTDRESGDIPYYGASGIADHVKDYIFDEPLLLISEDGANLLARSTPIAFSISGKTWVNNHAHVLKFNNIYTQRFVEFYINQIDISQYITGAAQPKLSQANLNKIHIPCPNIKVQERIVKEIESEIHIVEQNKWLIDIFEQKTADKIQEVWGEK